MFSLTLCNCSLLYWSPTFVGYLPYSRQLVSPHERVLQMSCKQVFNPQLNPFATYCPYVANALHQSRWHSETTDWIVIKELQLFLCPDLLFRPLGVSLTGLSKHYVTCFERWGFTHERRALLRIGLTPIVFRRALRVIWLDRLNDLQPIDRR